MERKALKLLELNKAFQQELVEEYKYKPTTFYTCPACPNAFETMPEQHAHFVECHQAFDPRARFADILHNIFHTQVKRYIGSLSSALSKLEPDELCQWKRSLVHCTKVCGFVL